MSLSLSSLLNPSPDADTQNSPPARKESLPPLQYVQSPEQQYTTSPQTTQPAQQRYSYSSTSDHEAVQALAALSGSSAPPPTQSQWYPQSTPDHSYDRRSNSFERRPGSSGYNEPIQLPPPSSMGRQPSSPTLDQYHVASRSPEQRRASMITPTQANFTLPPIQSFSPTQVNQTRPSVAYEQLTVYDHTQLPAAREDSSLARPAATVGSYQSKEQDLSTQEQASSQITKPSPPAQLQMNTSNMSAMGEELGSSPALVKQESLATPRASSPIEAQSTPAHNDAQSLKALASLKNEHGLRTHSPLRESSVPVPSTESTIPEPTIPKKRPAPSKTKKGTATSTKKAPPAKKRKVEPKRSVTPSSRASKPLFKTVSSVGTPADSSPAPSTRSQSAEADDEPYDDEDMEEDGDAGSSDDVYCICRKPDNGTFMIGCDGTCDDWFHGKCVGIEERDKNLIDKYVCPACTKQGAGQTTWKRMCRRSGCRQSARVGKTKSGKDGSKYCSEECGVMYFREMVARMRGREDTMKHRGSRRKGSFVSAEHPRPAVDDDLGARGGIISAGELKSLINTSKTAEDFKKLGEGVLSPPATPDSKSNSPTTTKKTNSNLDLTNSETQALAYITRQKDEARRKHQLLKDRMKLVTMVKQAASRMATEKDLKPKEYCGYDSRLEWSEEQFAAWRDSVVGKQAFELETLAREKAAGAADEDNDADMEEFEFEVCDRKKCARHLEWNKLAVDDVRFEMSDNGDHMRALDREEKEIQERAALRGKAGSLSGEGRVEVHGLGISLEPPPPGMQEAQAAMAVDAAA